MNKRILTKGRGTDNHIPAAAQEPLPLAKGKFKSHATGSKLPVQSHGFVAPHYGFQPLPEPNGRRPFRFDLSQLLDASEVDQITSSGLLVIHSIGDTGDNRGRQMDFVAEMMTADYKDSPKGHEPAFCYHLGDVVYFAGDVDYYGDCFYETYAEYPGPIVSIPGNHDCQPDDPQDYPNGTPPNPNKKPLDGWIKNFMSKSPSELGSLKTSSARTQLDLPNVYWTFTTPWATIIGLFSNVSETDAEIHPDQTEWFEGELKSADPDKALIVAIHHPPYSGDTEHAGSAVAEKILFQGFAKTNGYPHLILSGHVHNYQRFTVKERSPHGVVDVPCVVIGNCGYTRLGKLHKINNSYPKKPDKLSDTLTLENYDQDNFGFLRLEITRKTIKGTYSAAQYEVSTTRKAKIGDIFTIDLKTHKVTTLAHQQ